MSLEELRGRVSKLEQEVQELKVRLELHETRAAIRRGLDQADRGECIPAREWAQKVRAKYKLPGK